VVLPASEIERVFRAEYGRAVAVLVRVFGSIDIAEDAVQEAFTAATHHWPSTGLPPSPAGWIITTARNRAIDHLRREASRDDRHAQAALLHARDERIEEGPVRDERLRLIFTCCHPALGRGVQVALTLQLLGGLTTAEIARAFLNPRQLRTWAPRRPGRHGVRACAPVALVASPWSPAVRAVPAGLGAVAMPAAMPGSVRPRGRARGWHG
jgi:RNA polymerase sigma factor (sigma-70 family)